MATQPIPESVQEALAPLTENDPAAGAAIPTVMPADFYRHPAMLEAEIEQIFLGSWLCVGRADEIPGLGDYYTLELIGEPLVVTRSAEDQISVLSNVCRHRGSQVMHGEGNTRRLTCPYHKWTYALDGKLLSAPLVQEQPHFEKSQCALPEFRSHQWMGFIFVNLDGEADEFESSIDGLSPYVENYHAEQMRTVKAGPEQWPVNWKCLAENFMEGYHLTPVHLKTLHPMTPTRLCKKIPGGKGYTGYKSHYDNNFPGREPFHPDMTEEERSLSMMVWIYPGFVAAISPNSTVYMSISPTDETSLQTRWGVLAREELFESDEARARYDFAQSFNSEDKERLIDVQRGLSSRFMTRGPLAPADYEGTVWDFYHYIAARLK